MAVAEDEDDNDNEARPRLMIGNGERRIYIAINVLLSRSVLITICGITITYETE